MAPLKGPRKIEGPTWPAEDDSDLQFLERTLGQDPRSSSGLPLSEVRRLHACKRGHCTISPYGMPDKPECGVAVMIRSAKGTALIALQHSPADLFQRYGPRLLLEESFWPAILVLSNVARNPDVSRNDVQMPAEDLLRHDEPYRSSFLLHDDRVSTVMSDIAQKHLTEFFAALVAKPKVAPARSFENARIAVQLEERVRAGQSVKEAAAAIARERREKGTSKATSTAVEMAASRGRARLGWPARGEHFIRQRKSSNRPRSPRR